MGTTPRPSSIATIGRFWRGIVFGLRTAVRGETCPAGAFRTLADGVEAPRPVQQGRHLGPGHGGVADQADQADEASHVDLQLSIDSTVARVHQHGLNMTRELAAVLPSHTGGRSELQETTC